MSKLLRGVTAQLLLLTVLPLALVLAVISFGSIAMHQQAMRDLVGERDLRAVMTTANALGMTLQRKLAALRELAASASALPDPAASLGGGPEMRAASQELPGGIALYATDGRLIAATAGAQPWVTAGLAAGRAHAGQAPAQFIALDADLVLIGWDDGRRVAAVGRLPAKALRLDALVDPPGAGGSLTAYIFDSFGRVVDQMPFDRQLASIAGHAGVSEALRGERGVLYQPDAAGGGEHVVSYAPILVEAGATGLGILIEEPWADVLDPMMQYSLAGPLVSLPVLALALVAVAFGLRRIVQPLQALDRQAREIGAGRYEALAAPVRGIQEIEQLHATLRRMAARIQEDQERLRGYARMVTEAQESERGRLARELHDDTIQSLIVLSQRVQSMRLAFERGGPPDAARLAELRADILHMIEDVRRFSRALRPLYLEEAGLPAAIERLACEAAESAREGAAVTFKATGDIPRLKADVELALYRIAQEALTNAMRHAGATRIAIGLDGSDPDSVRLRIEDDGRGFVQPASGSAAGGFGLLGIRERAEMIGATVDLDTAPGRGTRLAVAYRRS
jgi:two-component system sensor histidine kinase UhpB